MDVTEPRMPEPTRAPRAARAEPKDQARTIRVLESFAVRVHGKKVVTYRAGEEHETSDATLLAVAKLGKLAEFVESK